MADPSVTDVRVDDAGLHLEPGFTGSGDVFFDGHHAWSFSAGDGGRSSDEVLVEWPKRMTRWLNGSSLVRVVSGDDEIFAGEVSFGDGTGRVRVDWRPSGWLATPTAWAPCVTDVTSPVSS